MRFQEHSLSEGSTETHRGVFIVERHVNEGKLPFYMPHVYRSAQNESASKPPQALEDFNVEMQGMQSFYPLRLGQVFLLVDT